MSVKCIKKQFWSGKNPALFLPNRTGPGLRSGRTKPAKIRQNRTSGSSLALLINDIILCVLNPLTHIGSYMTHKYILKKIIEDVCFLMLLSFTFNITILTIDISNNNSLFQNRNIFFYIAKLFFWKMTKFRIF